MAQKPKSFTQVISTALLDESGKLLEYCTLTVYKENETVEFSVITANGNAYVGKQFYEDDEHWEETLKIIKRLPPITLLQDKSAKIKKIGVKLSAFNLTETQKLAYRVEALESEVRQVKDQFKDNCKWQTTEPVKLGELTVGNKEDTTVNISNEILQNAYELLLFVSVQSNSIVKVWTVGANNEKYYKLVGGSTSVWLPYNPQDKKVHLQVQQGAETTSVTIDLIGHRSA